ncbi:MAG: branched-chain amino acid ABC transporter permease [Anaerolineales bacterium]|nr:branched-chain amino acid ABC transporter permease [Anaerolineales bacterium]
MQLLAFLISGLLLGFVYGTAAMGLTLIWGVMNVINLAHGPIIALGSFGVYLLFVNLGINPYLALVLVAIGGFLLGFVIYWVAIHRVINAPHLSTLLATFSVNMIIIGLGTAAFSTTPRNVGYSLGSLSFGPITMLGTRLVAALASVLVTALLYLFLYRTTPGKYVRAVANNRAAAELMGIPICVLGGLGNPLGALAGGLILGMLEGIIPNAKTWAYVLSAILPGMVGVLFYFKNGNVEPGDAFRLHFSIELLVMVMLGGFGTVSGPILSAAGYQRLRGLLLTTPVIKDFQLVVAGALLLLIILFIPAGAVGWLRNRFPVLRRVLP